MRDAQVKELIEAGKVRTVAVRRVGKGRHAFTVLVNGETLASARLDARGFASVDSAEAVLRELGLEVSAWLAVPATSKARTTRRKRRV